jgi:hypothetical protein
MCVASIAIKDAVRVLPSGSRQPEADGLGSEHDICVRHAIDYRLIETRRRSLVMPARSFATRTASQTTLVPIGTSSLQLLNMPGNS